MIVDLHNHYPRLRLRDRVRALLVGLASLFINYRSPFSGPRISIEWIAAREGVIGLILARYQLEDGPPPEVPGHRRRLTKEKRFEDSFETIRAHLDRIREITGSHRFTAIGSENALRPLRTYWRGSPS
jgi:hypothetical protein